MGFYYINKVHVERVYRNGTRYILVSWFEEVLEKWNSKSFEDGQEKEATQFALSKFTETA